MSAARPLSLVRRLGGALALAGVLAAGGAQSQVVGNGDQPIDITADGLELIDAQRVQVWSGAVEAVQGTNRLRTRLLRVYHAPKAGGGGDRMGQWGEAQRMVAEGEVYFLTPESAAKGEQAVYDLTRDTITMTGDVVLTRGPSVLRGDKLVINTNTGLATLDATAQGRGSKRVRGVFYPDEAAGRPAAAPAPRPRVSNSVTPPAPARATSAGAVTPTPVRPAAAAPTTAAPARDR